MSFVEILKSKSKKSRERNRVRKGDHSEPTDVGNELVDLTPDPRIAPANPSNATDILGKQSFKDQMMRVCIFIYGKIWFYNAILEILQGTNWNISKEIQIVHNAKMLTNSTQRSPKLRKPVVILPSVHDQVELNKLVSKALETKRPVWFVGYPSTLSKHLLVSFQSFFVCSASDSEIDILRDVTELSSLDTQFLKDKRSAVLISKGDSQSIHFTF